MGDNKMNKEDQMLEETFGSYDSELSAETGDFDQASKPVDGEEKKKKKSDNKWIFLGMGIAAICFLAYNLLFSKPPVPVKPAGANNTQKPSNTPSQAQNQVKPAVAPSATDTNGAGAGGLGPQGPQPTANANPQASNEAMNSFLANQTGAANNANTPAPAQTTSVVTTNPAMALNLSTSQGPNANAPSVSGSAAGGSQNETKVEVKVAKTDSQPEVKVSSVSTPNNQNDGMLSDMKSYLDGQFGSIKNEIGKFNSRLERQEQSQQELSATVADINTRLKRLESGSSRQSPSMNGSFNSRVSSTNTGESERKQVAKKAQPRVVAQKDASKDDKAIVQAQNTNAKNSAPSDTKDEVLIVSKQTAPSVVDMKNKKAKDAVVIINKYNVHSMYSGRFWIKNSDNTHSNFSVGDVLPAGERVLEVDMDKKVIRTDQGHIQLQ